MTDDADKPRIQITFSLPLTLMAIGVVLIGASFLPFGELAARSQWTSEDSAAYDRISQEYKRSSHESPQRRGVNQAEWDAQLAKMKQRMLALENRLERAKSQPQRWSRYLLGVGTLLTAAGFFAGSRY
ncbi:MAG: hypothetical protein AAGD11_12450 [Planctomycetota bacterium]